jgi:hypothetical protein
MRSSIITVLAVACVAVRSLCAQAPTVPAAQAVPAPVLVPPLTLIGCVTEDAQNRQFTLADEGKSGQYALTGTDMRGYVGKRVQVKSDSPNKLHIVGGLWPTPNVAAQAGAIDPAQAAVAALPGGGSDGANPFLEFHVTSVRTLKGRCK